MNIRTKFNVEDKVFTIDKKTMKIREFEIGFMCVCVGQSGNATVTYRAKGDSAFADSYEEDKCFSTKHELLTYIGQTDEQ